MDAISFQLTRISHIEALILAAVGVISFWVTIRWVFAFERTWRVIREEPSGLRVLKMRLAEGKLTIDQYKVLKKALEED